MSNEAAAAKSQPLDVAAEQKDEQPHALWSAAGRRLFVIAPDVWIAMLALVETYLRSSPTGD
jgi:hypothetical protein